MNFSVDDNKTTIFLKGRIDSVNALEFEKELIEEILKDSAADTFGTISQGISDNKVVILDVSELDYISSAGLRVLMKLRKSTDAAISIVNAGADIYDIMEVTGFTELFDVKKKLKKVSVDGLAMIGAGANGSIYRLNEETIIKVYNPLTNPPEKILNEKNVARKAFIRDIPSAISFDVVNVGDSYGIIYEMIDATTLGKVISADPGRVEEYAVKMAGFLKKLHSISFDEGELPDARNNLKVWADVAEKSGYYRDETIAKLRELIAGIPVRNTFVHGDFHPANIMVRDDEWLLIDMGDASVGHPVIDLLASYQIMRLIADIGNGAERYSGIKKDVLIRLWNRFIRTYFNTDDDEKIAKIESVLKYYAIIRSLAGVSFSDIIPEENRIKQAGFLEGIFNENYDRWGNSLLSILEGAMK